MRLIVFSSIEQCLGYVETDHLLITIISDTTDYSAWKEEPKHGWREMLSPSKLRECLSGR